MGLCQEYPHVLEIEDELALAYLETGENEQFEILLARVNARYSQLSEEFLCRIGRFWKDKGERETVQNVEAARRCFEPALAWYKKAFAVRSNYYPGINVAALQFVLRQVPQAQQTAEAVLRSLEVPTPPHELPWVLATRADAQLILGNNAEAERLYQEAKALSDPRGRASMRRQVELLLAYASQDSTLAAYWTSQRVDSVFGP
jgi:tetratricopeptide (TPR) repeat protein